MNDIAGLCAVRPIDLLPAILIIIGSIIWAMRARKGSGGLGAAALILLLGAITAFLLTQVWLSLAGQCSKDDGISAGQLVKIREFRAADIRTLPSPYPDAFLEPYNNLLRTSTLKDIESVGDQASINDVSVTTKVIPVSFGPVLISDVQVPGKLYRKILLGYTGTEGINLFCSTSDGKPFEFAGSECQTKAVQLFGRELATASRP